MAFYLIQGVPSHLLTDLGWENVGIDLDLDVPLARWLFIYAKPHQNRQNQANTENESSQPQSIHELMAHPVAIYCAEMG